MKITHFCMMIKLNDIASFCILLYCIFITSFLILVQAIAQSWVKESGLQTTHEGFICVDVSDHYCDYYCHYCIDLEFVLEVLYARISTEHHSKIDILR